MVLSAAILPALGIGDALLMMIASEQLQLAGYQVTTFHHALPELSSWFPHHNLQKSPHEEHLIETLSPFDLILVENDNSPKIKKLLNTFRPRLCLFYPSYRKGKHAPLSSLDSIFNRDIPMTDNIAHAMTSLIPIPFCKNNGITPPLCMTHRRNKKQILIHPTSRVPSKNWRKAGFISIAHTLRSKGFDPLFCVSPSEQEQWATVKAQSFRLAETPSLSDLAALVYESGYVIGNDSLTGHLASNLNIPTLIIAEDKAHMRLWRPGWLQGEIIFPPSYLCNFGRFKVKERYWPQFISTRKVLRAFDKLCCAL